MFFMTSTISEKAPNPNRSFVVIPADVLPIASGQEMAQHYGYSLRHTEVLALCPTDANKGVAVLRTWPGGGKHAKPVFAVAHYIGAEGQMPAGIDFDPDDPDHQTVLHP